MGFANPIRWRMSKEVAERKRWASCSVRPRGCVPLRFLPLFCLAYVLGDIMDSAVSLCPVPREAVLAHDKTLKLHGELAARTISRIARALTSPDAVVRRLGVQRVILLIQKNDYLHSIRVCLWEATSSSSAIRNNVDYVPHAYAQRYIPSSTVPACVISAPCRSDSDVRRSYDGAETVHHGER